MTHQRQIGNFHIDADEQSSFFCFYGQLLNVYSIDSLLMKDIDKGKEFPKVDSLDQKFGI